MGLSLSRCCSHRRSSRIGTAAPDDRISSSHSFSHTLSALIPGMSQQLNSSSLRRNFGNHLTITSTKDSLEFVHGAKQQHTEMKLDEDGFHFHHLIDTGGFGFVFKASRKTTQVEYALKVQPLEFMAQLGNGFRKTNEVSLQMEKTALAACRGHPFIVNLEYSFQTSLYAILVLEYVSGGTLSRLISHSPEAKLPCDLARLYTAEIALALNFMHEKGIIYRDVKPSNALIGNDGHIKMTDFGLAGSMLAKKKNDINPQENSHVEEESTHESEDQQSSNASMSSEMPEDETSTEIQGDLRRVRRRTLCGTAGYRPPEQVGERYVDYRNRNGYDERVDFFSLGVTLYTMLYGRRPFPTRRQMMLGQEGISSPTQRRSSISDNHTSAIQRKVTRQLRKDIEFRCLMSEVTFPDLHDDLHDSETKSFVSSLLARDPNDRPRFNGIKNHPWMSGIEFDAVSLKGKKMPDWVTKYILNESRARPKSMRRSSMTSFNNTLKSGVSLSSFIEDICAQMIEIGKNEEAENAVARWMTKPTSSTKELFRHWNYISDDALKLEMNVKKQPRRHLRRATTQNTQLHKTSSLFLRE